MFGWANLVGYVKLDIFDWVCFALNVWLGRFGRFGKAVNSRSKLSVASSILKVATIVLRTSSSSWHHSQPELHHSSLQSISQ